MCSLCTTKSRNSFISATSSKGTNFYISQTYSTNSCLRFFTSWIWPSKPCMLTIPMKNTCSDRYCRHIFSRVRSSLRPEVFYKKGALKNIAKFTGKHLCQSLFLHNIPGLRHRCFPVNFAKFLRTPFLQNTTWRLLLKTVNLWDLS